MGYASPTLFYARGINGWCEATFITMQYQSARSPLIPIILHAARIGADGLLQEDEDKARSRRGREARLGATIRVVARIQGASSFAVYA